jgi:hypothetical protein
MTTGWPMKKGKPTGYAFDILREGAPQPRYTRGDIPEGFIPVYVTILWARRMLDIAAQAHIGRSLVKFNSALVSGNCQCL